MAINGIFASENFLASCGANLVAICDSITRLTPSATKRSALRRAVVAL